MDKKKIALIVVVLFLLIGLGSFVFANPDQDNNLEGPGVSEDGGSGDGEVIDGTEPTATPEEENDDSATETDPITTYGNGGNGTGTDAGNNGTTGGVGNTDMSSYDDARRIIEELENRVNSMKNKDDSNNAVDYRTDTGIIDMVNNLPDGTVKDELKDRLDAINKVLDDTKAPVITGINNGDVTKENVTINVTDDNDVTITATLDGEEIEFTTPLTEEGHYVVTVTDKNFNTTTVEFTIDKTPIALDWLYVLNNSGTDYKVIGDGQKLYVELVFSEEFTSTPMIQIGNAEAVEMSCHWTNWQTEKQYFKCDATITIDGSTMGLENGKEVPVQITNVLDAAGNETVLTNENIIETEKYGHVIYDNQAPKMEVLRLTNVSRKDENGAWLQVAKAGDIVRVIVQFNENLATLPTLKVNGTEVGVMKYDSNMQSYTYDYKVTENDVNGVMQIEISNYADAAGNVGVKLTNEDINHATQNQVVIDTVAPEYAAMGIFNWTNDNDGTDRTYATKNEHIRLFVSFPEMLATNPKVDIYGMDGKVTTLDLSYSEAAKFYFVEFDTTDEFALPEGKINFKVYGYADEAGNVGADLTQDMTTSNKYPQVIYDSIAPVLNFNNGFITDAFTVVATDDNFDYMTVQYYDGREMKTITENTFTLDAEGDNIRYNIKAYDKAGNVSAYADIYLDTQKPVITGTGKNGKNDVNVANNGYYKNATIHFEDGSLKKVVLVNEDGTEEVLEEYEDNYTTSKMVFDRTFTEDGTYTIKAIDRKGNETVVTFTIDNAVPKITVKEDYVGNLDKNVFSNLSFKLYDNTGVSAYKINDGEYKELTVNNWSDANFQNIKNALVYGKNTITLRDVAGNEAVYEFVYDNVKPTITVKEGYVGNLDKNVFSNVSFSLYDEYEVVAYKINDGEYGEFTINNWSDANFQNIVSRLVYGKNTITLKDVAGNEAVYEFVYDNVKPTITVKEGYVGSLDQNIFSNVSFSLYDEYEVVAYKINDGEYGEFTINNWSDANFQNIVSRLVYGKNTITLKDVAGNEAVYEFVYDHVSPGPRVVGITGFFNEAEGADAHYITTGESVRILTYYDEKLGTAPMVKIGNKEFQTYYAEQSSSEENGSYAYYADIKITQDLGLSDGEIQFSIHGHKDAAGNEGRAYTNADVTYTESSPYEIRYDKVILDNTAPEFNVTSGTHSENTMEITITDDNYNYAKIVNQDNGVSENVDKPTFTLQQEATYHIYAYDKAGNEADLWVAIDNENPTVTVSGIGVDGYYRSGVTIQAFDKFLTSVKVNEDTVDRSSFTSDGRNENFSYETTVNEEGTYTVTATDKYGHSSTEYTFVIDKTRPVVQGAVDGGLYNTPVTLTVIEENLQNAEYQKDGGDWVSFESGTVLDQDGTYFVRVTDKADNEKAELTFTIDQTDPVVKAANILVDGDVNEQIEFYATTGDTIYSYVRFSEELKQNPKFYLVNNGTEYEVSDVTVTGPNDNGEYTYSIRYTITKDNTMTDGQIEMKVTGISDKAGNTIDDITKPTNGHIVYLDRVAPTATAFRMVGGNRETENGTYMYATNGAKIYIYAEFANKLAVSPKALINDSIEVSFNDGTLRGDRYIYSAIYTVQENDGLQDGELQVKVYGYADEAGNVGKKLSNEDITLASQKYIIIDKTAPELNIKNLVDGYSKDKALDVSGTDANKLGVVISNAEGNAVKTDSSSQSSDGTYRTAYTIQNEIGIDGQYTAVASDVAGNKTTVTFTVDREAPKFDLSAIPTTFTIGKDIYQYPQPGVVTDNIDGNISFGEVHMNWYHKNADGTREATQCFGGDNWNTSLTSCEPGDYIITYRVSDKAGNETSEEQTMTLVKEVVDNEKPVIKGVETNNDYSETRVLEIYDNSGSATVYIDFNNGYTSPVDLMDNVQPLNIFNATEDKPYKLTIPKASGLSVYVVDGNNNAAFVTRVTIN